MRSKRSILLLASIASFMTPYTGAAINVALPSIGQEFNADAIQLSWVAMAFLLASAVSLVPLGRFADMYGRRIVFIVGMTIFTIASYLAIYSSAISFLIAMRVLQGIGSSMIFGTGMAILLSVYPPAERGTALGINVAAVYLGLSIGPIAGGFLIQSFGWRALFVSNLPIGIFVFGLAAWILPKDNGQKSAIQFDVPGAAVFGLALIMALYSLSHIQTLIGAVLLPLSLVFFILFVRIELCSPHPMMDLGLFRRNVVFLFSNLAALINYSATAAVGFLLSMYLQYAKGLTPREAGIVMIAQPIAMTLFSPLAGRSSDAVEPRIVASAGMALTAVSLALFATVTISTGILFVIACSALLGFGFALFSSPNTNAVMRHVPKEHFGMASGIIGTMRLVGQMGSMALAAVILDLNVGKVQITSSNLPGFVASMQQIFAICCALCLCGVFASLARGKMHGISS